MNIPPHVLEIIKKNPEAFFTQYEEHVVKPAGRSMASIGFIIGILIGSALGSLLTFLILFSI